MLKAEMKEQSADLPVWSSDDMAGSLLQYRSYVEAQALRSLDWYARSRRTVRLLACGLQYARVLLMGLAAILPIAGQLSGNALLSNALLVCLLVGASAALQAGDKHLGISSAWVRYVMAATQIRRSLEEFRMDFVLLMAKSGADPTARQAEALLQLARRFHLGVEALVSQDTQAWATGFRDFSQEVDKAA